MRFVPTLYVERLEGSVRYRLELPERDAGRPIQEEFDHRLDQATITALRQSADALLRGNEAIDFVAEARRRGSVLYRTLLPVRLRDQLKTLSGPILISTSLLGIPWELLHDEEEFWGLRYAIGKRIMMSRPLANGRESPAHSRPRALIVGSDPRGDLPFVRTEVDRLCRTLKSFTDVSCVSGYMATFEAVTAHLREGFDVIHYCGHVVAEKSASPALLLADETPLAADVIESNLGGHPLVFLNGCASARDDKQPSTGAWEEHVSSVAYGFLFGGAAAVVGTLCDVSDGHAASLAEAFYRRSLARVAIGEALRAAREQCRSDPETAKSPTWLSFVMYGNPAQVLFSKPDRVAPGTRSSVIVPARGDTRRLPRSQLLWAACVGLLLVAGALGYRRLHGARPQGPMVIGVMEVRGVGGDVPDWMRELTRDSFNTILSKVPDLRVYSHQKIDFFRTVRHLSEIEAGEELGMSKMVSVTLAVSGATVSLEAQIVGFPAGFLEASEHAQGSTAALIDLQTELAMKTLHALGVETMGEALRQTLANRTNETLDSYRLLNRTLDRNVTDQPDVLPDGPRPPEPSSFNWQSVAYAQEPSPDERAIRAVLDEYRAALQRKDVDAVVRLQGNTTDEQRDALAQYFASAAGLTVQLLDIDLVIEGDNALATLTREDVFTDGPTGRRLHLELRISMVLGREDGAWKIRTLRKPS